jgi:hypothetical protein
MGRVVAGSGNRWTAGRADTSFRHAQSASARGVARRGEHEQHI